MGGRFAVEGVDDHLSIGGGGEGKTGVSSDGGRGVVGEVDLLHHLERVGIRLGVRVLCVEIVVSSRLEPWSSYVAIKKKIV